MNRSEIEFALDRYLGDGPEQVPDRVIDAALDTIDHTRQRRAVRMPWRFPTMNIYGKFAIAAVAVVALGAVGLAMLRPATSPTGPGPGAQVTPSPSVIPSPSPSPSVLSGRAMSFVLPEPESPNNGAVLESGRWQLSEGFPVTVSVDVPDGWMACSIGPVEQGVCGDDEGGIGFLIVKNVVADPCSEALAKPAVGPSVDDLVGAISKLKGFTATEPTDITVSGYRGKQFIVTSPDTSSCELRTWATKDRINGVGLGEANLLQIVDVDGVRVLIAVAYTPTTDAPDVPAPAAQALASIQITK